MRFGSEGGGSPTVATVLLPVERSRVDAAGSGCFAVVHRDSIPDAVRIVRERPVDAVLVSVHRCGPEQVEVLGHLVREFPGIPTVALVSQHDPSATEMLLRLGASGVRQVVDVTSPTGWSRLRQVVGQPATRAVARIQGPILDALAEAPADTRLFLEAMIRLAPETPTVTNLAQRLYVRPSTLMSRFARAGLPLPRTTSRPFACCMRPIFSRPRASRWPMSPTGWSTPRPRASAAISGPCSASPRSSFAAGSRSQWRWSGSSSC